MARPTVIADERILKAAREVFLEKGLGATTAEVAERAGVAQGSLFKRFKTKQELFLAAMHSEHDQGRWLARLAEHSREVGLREALVEMGVTVIAFLRRVVPLGLMVWSNRGQLDLPRGGAVGREGPLGRMQEVVAFFEAEMRAGRLRKHDPWLVVRTFAATLQSYALMECILKQPLGPAIDPETYVRGVVDILWSGIGPKGPQ